MNFHFTESDEGEAGQSSDGDNSDEEFFSDAEYFTEEEDFSDSESEMSDAELNLDENNNDKPLYPGAPITVMESLLAILAVYLKNNLTKVALSQILELISLHCIKPNNCISSWYKLEKFLSKLKNPFKRNFYCNDCHISLREENSQCPECLKTNNSSYFISGSVISQIQALFKRKNFIDKLSYKSTRVKKDLNNLEDIYDGEIYKELSSDNGILSSITNLSFTWYTDGLPIFKSSKFSIWPFF